MNKDSSFNIFPLFSTPIYESNVGEFDQNEIDLIKNNNGYLFVNDSIFICPASSLVNQLPKLISSINVHLTNYLIDTLRFNQKVQWKISDVWFVRCPPGTGNLDPHKHCNSLFSGVVYIDSNDKGSLSFIQRTIYGFGGMQFDIPLCEETPFNIHNAHSWDFFPENGDILLFPSSTEHLIGINHSDSDRYSLAFNVVPTGKINDFFTSRLSYDL